MTAPASGRHMGWAGSRAPGGPGGAGRANIGRRPPIAGGAGTGRGRRRWRAARSRSTKLPTGGHHQVVLDLDGDPLPLAVV
jgi:hypothetical protein